MMQRFRSWILSLLLALPTGAVPAQQSATPVTVQPFAEVAVFPVRSAPATAVSLNDTQISAEIGGTLRELPVRVGDRVEAGAVIATLDCEDHRLAREQAQARLEIAEAERAFAGYQHERATTLARKGSVSEELLRERRTRHLITGAQVTALRAALRAAERATAKCELRAPFGAVIVERIASVGELAHPGAVVLRLLDDEHIEISASVQEQDLASLQTARSPVFIDRGRRFPVRLRALLPLVDSRLRSHEVRLEPQPGEPVPAPGAAGRLEWRSGKPHVPPELLITRDGRLGVFVADSGSARFEPIPDAQAGRPAALALPPDTLLIIDGRFTLQDRTPVRATES